MQNAMSEQKLQTKILNWLKKEGFFTFKTISCNKNGIPDIIACKDSFFYGIEVKQPGGVVSPIQSYQIEQIKKKGGTAFVAHSLEDVIHSLQHNPTQIKAKPNHTL